MRCHRPGWLLLALSFALTGCEVVQDQLNDAPAAPAATPTPSEPAAPAPEPVAPLVEAPAAEAPAGEAVPAEEPAAASDDILAAVGAAAAAATGAGDRTAEGGPAVGTEQLGSAVAVAGRQSVEETLQVAEQAARRAAAEAELAARRDRQRQYLADAQRHLEYLGLRLKDQEADLATTQTALLQASLEGLRRQGGRGPADDELSFALGALYDLATISRDQDQAVANAVTHLDAALGWLPAPGPAAAGDTTLKPGEARPAPPEKGAPSNAGEDPRSSPAALAREIVAIKELFAAGNKRTGRDRLQALVLDAGNGGGTALLALAGDVADRLALAVARRAWAEAEAQRQRIGGLLTELSSQMGPAAAGPGGGHVASAAGRGTGQSPTGRAAGPGASGGE